MQVSKYLEIVTSTDQFSNYEVDKRKQISLYGLVGEIGSLTSAVKKAMLAGYENASNDEVIEELGDVFWYLFNLVNISEINNKKSILKNDIMHIRKEVTDPSMRGERIREALTTLDDERLQHFMRKSEEFLTLEEVTFSQYQEIAYLTARTEGNVLNDVCLAVLWQLGAELLRTFTMPSMELVINQNIVRRNPEIVIGEIAWHLAAIASVHGISLGDVVDKNVGKARFRSRVERSEEYYDQNYPEEERLPRSFQVSFVSISPRHARMYYQGRPLGDDLTDNAYEEDGYRFHDVMHLANAACLRWSPVLRRLLKRKRKSSRIADEVEDGARAAIVEELVIKAIHAEGKRLRPNDQLNGTPLFPEKGHITFGLIKTVVEYVKGLEVQSSQEWQWRNAIFEGSRVYQKLLEEGQGTVTVDLEKGLLSFDPRVDIGIAGVVGAMGTATLAIGDVDLQRGWITSGEICANTDNLLQAEVIAAKRAMLNALGFSDDDVEERRGEITLSRMESGTFSVRATGRVRERMWEMGIVEFKSTLNRVDGIQVCTALGMADPKDTID